MTMMVIMVLITLSMFNVANKPETYIQGDTKNSKPLPNYQKLVLNRIKACQCDYMYSLY